ncbi:MAG: response regulator transcription factor [Deltaproteobacteria bacterium]|nr:response regulator transcription factor [Deltaproteobacteria bacterium]
MTRKKLLIADDELENRNALRDIFKDEFDVEIVTNGKEAVDKAPLFQPDLILLDIMMPVMDGNTACHMIRKNPKLANIPIVFLTSRQDPEAEIFGLELGASDFIHKPFNKSVLKARVKRHLSPQDAPEQNRDHTRIEDFEIHWDRQEVWHGKERIPLTMKEVKLLDLLVNSKGRTLTREMILEKIWDETFITDRTVDSHIKVLRKKIPPLIKRIKTVYGSGYRLDE